MFYIGEHLLDGAQFVKELSPLIAMLFSINDRGIRGSLLKKVPLMVKHLDKSSLNSSVFEPMCSGFSDSSGALRELTLKATLSLVPHLTPPNLEKLSRYLVRLQNDDQPAIRTNTVIFISKLAPHLSEMTRQKMLLPAFTRAMKDPFTPCRLAALQSTLQAKKFFDPQGIASKVLPAVTPCCVDVAANVRKEAFSAVDDLLYLLRQESERLASLPDADVNGGMTQPGSSIAAAPSSGNAVPVPAQHAPQRVVAPATAPVKPKAPVAAAPAPSSGSYFSSWMSSSSSKAVPTVPAPAPLPPPPLPSAQPESQTDDGWDDDSDGDGWGDDDVNDAVPAPKPAVPSMTMNAGKSEDDFFGAAFANAGSAKPANMAMRKPAVGKLKVPNKGKSPAAKPKPAVTKIVDDEPMEDGWDDF